MQWLLVLYPFLVHAAVVTDSRWLAFVAMIVLGGNLLAPVLARTAVWAWLGLAGVVAGSAWFAAAGDGRYFLYAAPVLIAVALCWLFGRSLMPDREPLVARIADAMRGPLPPRVHRYTRAVTWFWTVLLASLAAFNLLLAVVASPAVWSLFANFINYFVLVGVFVGEWFFRCWYLAGDEGLNWRQYLRGLARLDYRRL